MSAVKRLDQGGSLNVEGKLTNVSPLRDMSYHVTVETDAGFYAEWAIYGLGISKSATLNAQRVTKLMRNGGRNKESNTFRVRIRSAPADSDIAESWKRGELPVPEYQP